MSSKTNITTSSGPVQLGQPQFPVRHGTVLYQLLESSSKESNRVSSHISIKPSTAPPQPPKKPVLRMRRSNIPIPIGRNSNNTDPQSYRRFRNPNVESVEESNDLMYACKPVESRKFEESLRKYDSGSTSISRPSRSAPTSRLPSPSPTTGSTRRPATTITAEARRALSRAKLSSFKESSERYEGYNSREPSEKVIKASPNKPPPLPPPGNTARIKPIPIAATVMKSIESQTINEPLKIKAFASIETQTRALPAPAKDTNANNSKTEASLSVSNGNVHPDKKKSLLEIQTQTEDNDNDMMEYRREFIRLLQEKDALCTELADQLRDKISECAKLQTEVNSLNSELVSIVNINIGLQNKVLGYSRQEQDRALAELNSHSVFIQTESLDVIQLRMNKSDKSTLTEEKLNSTSPASAQKSTCDDHRTCDVTCETIYDNSSLEEEDQIPEGIKLGRRSSLSAAKEWIDSTGPPFDFSSLQTFSAEEFMKTPSCQDALLPTLRPVKHLSDTDPDPHPQMIEFDRQSAEDKNLLVLKAAKEHLEEIMGSQSNVHTTHFIQRLQKKKEKREREEKIRISKISEMSLNPEDIFLIEEFGRRSKKGKAGSFNGETTSESQEQLNKTSSRRSRRSRQSGRGPKSRSESKDAQYHRRNKPDRVKSKEEVGVDMSKQYHNKGWTPEEAEKKRRMINEVFNALQLSPKSKVDEVCGTIASHVINIGIGSDFPKSDAAGPESSERPRPRQKRRDLQRISPTTCLVKKS